MITDTGKVIKQNSIPNHDLENKTLSKLEIEGNSLI